MSVRRRTATQLLGGEKAGWHCAACGGDHGGRYSIHRDGFGKGPEVPLCDDCGESRAQTCADLWAAIRQRREAEASTCCPMHDYDADDPITAGTSECQLMHAWGIGEGEWLGTGTGTPEEAAQRAGWEILHSLEEHPGAVLARPRTSRTALYIVAELGGPRAVQVAQ